MFRVRGNRIQRHHSVRHINVRSVWSRRAMMLMQGFFARRPKLLTRVALGTAILLVVGAVALTLVQDSLHRTERHEQIAADAGVLAASVSSALARNDVRGAQEDVDALQKNPELEAAAVFGGDGHVLARFTRGGAEPITAYEIGRASCRERV